MSHDYVIDASVGIKLFVVEDLSEVADQLFDQLTAKPPAQFYVPDLFFIECTNILWKYVRRFDYPAENARQDVIDLRALSTVRLMNISIICSGSEYPSSQGVFSYRSVYVFLASPSSAMK